MTKKATSKKAPTKKPRKKKESKKVLGVETKDMVMVRSAIDPDARFFVAQEQADESVIESEMIGKMIAECVYEFPAKGNAAPVRGLTITGVREAVRYINKNPKSGMRIGLDNSRMFTEEVERNGQRGILAKCLAVDHISGDSNWGIKFQPYIAKRKDGSTYQDTFVEEKATSKAQRNAKAGLIPVQLKLKIIEKFAKDPNNVKQLEAAPSTQEAPRSMKESTSEEVGGIIMRAIESTDDPERLQDLVEKIEHGKKLTKNQKQMLSSAARNKINRLLDKKAIDDDTRI
jgi:hypothetical protein